MIQEKGLGTYTGSALIDASNIFLNQLGIAGFNRLVSELGKLANKPGVNEDGSDSDPSTSSTADPRRTDRSQLTSALRKVIKPRFNVRADYNLLSNLAVVWMLKIQLQLIVLLIMILDKLFKIKFPLSVLLKMGI